MGWVEMGILGPHGDHDEDIERDLVSGPAVVSERTVASLCEGRRKVRVWAPLHS